MYKAKLEMGRHSFYYRNNELLFSFYIKSLLCYIIRDCHLFDIENKEILIFREKNFAFGFSTKILNQNLPEKIELKRKSLNSYLLNVKGNEIYLKQGLFSYQMKNFGKFFVNGKEYGNIIKENKIWDGNYYNFYFNFKEENNPINFYCMILFSMMTVGFANIR